MKTFPRQTWNISFLRPLLHCEFQEHVEFGVRPPLSRFIVERCSPALRRRMRMEEFAPLYVGRHCKNCLLVARTKGTFSFSLVEVWPGQNWYKARKVAIRHTLSRDNRFITSPNQHFQNFSLASLGPFSFLVLRSMHKPKMFSTT